MDGRTLWLWANLPKNLEPSQDQSWIRPGDSVENVQRLSLGGHMPGSFDMIKSGVRFPQTVQHDIDLLGQLCELTKPGGQVKIVQAVVAEGIKTPGLCSANKLISNLKLSGLTNIQTPVVIELLEQNQKKEIHEALKLKPEETFQLIEINCSTPNFQTGSSTPLSFAQKIKSKQQQQQPIQSAEKKVWSLKLDTEDDDVDLIDEDDLLDEEDLKRPDQASLRVCGTTGKRKACKGCSCGLAEELDSGNPKITKKSFTSSCGSCYLGDAFRCASCPYLGMPAFKPGEKIQLSERQLKADQ
jgi:hypothetical protein